ncbi:putative hydantoin utilization protein C [Thozetella sp. PMI_491]|nr:putative hydantoin utilization protein C [Thozetella sp. PMI_491]
MARTAPSLYGGLKINGPRLLESIHATCQFGSAHRYGDHPTETGMARLSLDDNDKKVRNWLREQVEALGCDMKVDQMGNMFAVRQGKAKNAAPVMMGSHLDTQPTGGRYDGILGVLAALEVLRTLHENDYETEGPVGLINWTNEEGARFPMVTVSSGVWAETVPLETAWNCKEVIGLRPGSEPQTMKQELERIGFLGDIPASYKSLPIAAHFEVHIEQGPILEQEGRTIGVVTGGQAYNWYEVEITGRDSHAGTTPFSARKDAILAAAKMITSSNRVAKECSGLITTGIIRAEPGSVNTMARTVRFTLDCRHPDDAALSEMVSKCRVLFDKISKEECELGVTVNWTTLTENPAVKFHPDCIAAIEEAAHEVCSSPERSSGEPGKGWRHMLSGAGHDSCNTSKRCPTAMIFTPTRNGASHCPDEYCSPEGCIAGAQVLLGAVVRYDAMRPQREDLS